MHMDEKSKYMARIDADCRADECWLMSLWEAIKNSDSTIAGVG